MDGSLGYSSAQHCVPFQGLNFYLAKVWLAWLCHREERGRSHDLSKMSSQISECMCAERKSSLCFLSLPFPHWKTQLKGKKLLCKWKYICHIALCRRNNLTFDHTWNFLRNPCSAASQISLRLLLLSKLKEKNISGGLTLSFAAFGVLWPIPCKCNILSLTRFSNF